MKSELITYEESVHWMRAQPELADMVRLCYLDADNLAAARRYAASEEFQEVVRLLNLSDASRKLKILDLGCGNGIASYALASTGHDLSALDLDLSEDVGLGAVAKLAQTLKQGSIDTFQSVAESLPFAEATFDIVFARQALHHFTDLDKSLSECSRVLKPGGLLLAVKEHVIDDEPQLQAFLDNHPLHRWHGGENAYSLQRYQSALEGAGFKIRKNIGPFDSPISQFDVSDEDVKASLQVALERRLGKLLAPAISNFPYVERYFRHRLSETCRYPGRLYSFFCVNR